MSDLKVTPTADGGVSVSIHVKNTGSVVGDEVPQVYLNAPENKPQGVQFAPKTLAAFDRVTLQPGEERDVTLEIAPRAFEYWSVDKKAWVKPTGSRTLRAGTSSQELPLTAAVQ